MSLRNTILAANDLPKEEVDTTAEWGEKVFVRTMTGRERDAFDAASSKIAVDDRLENFRSRLATATICDADGALIFTSADAVVLGEKSANALGKVYKIAAKLNGLFADDVAEAKEELKKTTQDDSFSALLSS